MKKIYTLLSILIISLTVYFSYDDLMPSSVKSIETTGFSVDNALSHLKVISKEPHYTGSKYHQEVQNYIVMLKGIFVKRLRFLSALKPMVLLQTTQRVNVAPPRAL